MDRITRVLGYVNLADRILEDRVIEGVGCFGLEISAKKYGNNPDGALHRVWLDVETKLPVRMEFEWPQDDGLRKRTKDRFKWNPYLPEGTFMPRIPKGFTLVDESDG